MADSMNKSFYVGHTFNRYRRLRYPGWDSDLGELRVQEPLDIGIIFNDIFGFIQQVCRGIDLSFSLSIDIYIYILHQGPETLAGPEH